MTEGSPDQAPRDKSTGFGGGNGKPDPTKNVLDLVAAGIKRQDDLRAAELNGMREYFDAKFAAIDREMTRAESYRAELKNDTTTAIGAAMAAQEKFVREQQASSEKAIEKSEKSAAEQSKQQSATIAAELKGLSDSMSALKDRVVTIESMKAGSQEVRTSQKTDIGMFVGIVGAVIAVLTFIWAMNGGGA